MKILQRGLKKGYTVHKVTESNYQLCRILQEYNSKEEADKDLIKLLTHKKTEKDILKEYSKKESY